jgi:hypothetical protein
MELDNVIDKDTHHRGCCVGVVQRHEVPVLGEAVDNDKDDVGIVRQWQSLNEIHCDVVSCTVWHQQWLN